MKIDSDKLYAWRERIENVAGDVQSRMGYDEAESTKRELAAVADEIFEAYLDALLEERKALDAKSERSDPSVEGGSYEKFVWLCGAKRYVTARDGSPATYSHPVAEEIARVLTAVGEDAEAR